MRLIALAALLVYAAPAEQLRITAYDKARISPGETETVVNRLRRVFRQSGIEIDWIAGDLDAPEASLMLYHTGVRNQDAACRARRGIALDILPAEATAARKGVLGMAQPLSGAGLNVRIFDGHIKDAAARANRAYATVLSYAIAHEIGHVLLRSNAHSGRGLMSAVWTAVEYEWMRKEALFFNAEESRKMRSLLSNAACESH